VYVSISNGSDDNDGSEAHPFKSLQRTQLAVRQMIENNGGAVGAIVNIRGGLYELEETLVFSAADGGQNAASPVVWQAYTGEEVVISGGEQLQDLQWEPASLPNSSKTLKASLNHPMNFTSLFVGKTRAVRARWPNGDPSENLGSSMDDGGVIGPCVKRDDGVAQEWGGFPPWKPQCHQTTGLSAPHRKGWAQSGGCPGGEAAQWKWPTKPIGISGNVSR
jgi:hypothetical protein